MKFTFCLKINILRPIKDEAVIFYRSKINILGNQPFNGRCTELEKCL